MGQLWEVPRALGSNNMHYFTLLCEHVWGAAASGAEKFTEAFPDAVLSDGLAPLTAEALRFVREEVKTGSDAEYVKHILAKHDGEARHWGPPRLGEG